MRTSASSSSFQAPVKVKIATAAMPGAESGSTMRISAPKRRVPVDHPLLLELARHAAEVALQQPGRERQREGEVDEDQPEQRVAELAAAPSRSRAG